MISKNNVFLSDSEELLFRRAVDVSLNLRDTIERGGGVFKWNDIKNLSAEEFIFKYCVRSGVRFIYPEQDD